MSSSFDPKDAETRTITAVSGNTFTLDSALTNEHLCVTNRVAGTDLRQCAEVALLSRNIVITGDDVAEFGAHVIIAGGSGRITGVEVTRAGQAGRLGRYGLHYHLNGDSSGQYMSNNSVHHLFHKGIVVHGTSNTRVSGNVVYDTQGHSYMIAEDGVEIGNVFEGNLGGLARMVAADKRVIASDAEPANFWLQNPNNILRNNVAAGAEYGHGFWYDLPKWPTGNFQDCTTCASPSGLVFGGDGTPYPADKSLWGTPFGEFVGNVAHSSSQSWKDGNIHGAGITGGGSGIRIGEYLAQTKEGAAILRDSSAYWNGAIGFWLDSDPMHTARTSDGQIRLIGAKAADNKHAIHSIGAIVEDSLMAGLVSKKDMFWTSGETYGGTAMASFTYDDVTHFKGVTFANWQAYTGPDGIQRGSGVFGIQDGRFQVEIPLFASGIKWVNADPAGAMTTCGYSYDPGHQARCEKARAFAVEFADGSLLGSGQAESLVYNNPLLTTSDCKATSNPLLVSCSGGSRRYIALRVDGVNGTTELVREDGARNTMSAVENQTNLTTLVKAEEIYTLSTGSWSRLGVKIGYDQPYSTWVILAVPYANAASVSGITQVASLQALRSATTPAWYNDTSNKRIYLKNYGDWTDICAAATCN